MFTTGPYGEIIPELFIAGLTPAETWQKAGLPDTPGLTNEQRLGLAAMTLQQRAVIDVFRGRPKRAGYAQHLYDAVVEGRQPLSLRPLGDEETYPFAPVLRRLDAQTWQVGVEEYGRHHSFNETDPSRALFIARTFFISWQKEERNERNQL